MRGKKALLIVTISLFLGAIIAPHTPVKAQGTRIYVWSPNGCYPHVAAGSPVDVYVCVDIPCIWDNTANGLVAWEFEITVNSSVLQPYTCYGDPTSGYYFTDFCDCHGYPPPPQPLWFETYPWGFYVNSFLDAGLGVGAGCPGCREYSFGCPDFGDEGYGPLVRCRFRALLDYAGYSPINLSETYYYTLMGKYAFDEVNHGCYGIPPIPEPPISEFPLGAEAAIGIGLMAATVYIWLRKHKTKPTITKHFTT